MGSLLTKDHTVISFSLMPGDFDTCSDPSAAREVTLLRKSADGQQEAVGGRVTFEDLTLTRYWEEARDMPLYKGWKANPDAFNDGALSLVNKGSDGVLGQPDTYVGTVKSMQRAGSDANSADPAKLTVVMSVTRGA